MPAKKHSKATSKNKHAKSPRTRATPTEFTPETKAFAAHTAKARLGPFQFDRRTPGDHDVAIAIRFCGICHSDIHQVREEWGSANFPMVPGHEIVGHVTQVGKKVKKFKVGDAVGVGCMVDSCGKCGSCKEGLEQYCGEHFTGTYNSKERDGVTITQGGYSSQVVVKDSFVLKLSPKLDLAATAPLLCAGITTYSPLRHWKIKKGQKVGVVGIGGLGHMGIKFARAFGAHTVAFTHSEHKKTEALRLGAHEVVLSSDKNEMQKHLGTFDFILNTVSAVIDYAEYLNLLKPDGTFTVVGVPDRPTEFHAFPLIMGRKALAGSLIGGIKETQEMLDFCAKHNIVSDIEVIPMQEVNEAYDRVVKGDVKYRFVIDMNSL